MKKFISKIKINLKQVGNIFYRLIVCVLILVAALVGISAINIPGGIKLYTVQSGSMEPAIHTGSVAISKPFESYQKGDVVTFKAEKDRLVKNPRETTTHRIYEITIEDGKEEYVTKGDSNNAPDIKPISKDLILGKTIFSFPFLGYPVSFAKTREGLIILVVIPATIIIYSELMNIKNEAKKLLKERRKRKLTTKEKIEEKIGEEIVAVEKELGNTLKGKKSRKGSKA